LNNVYKTINKEKTKSRQWK